MYLSILNGELLRTKKHHNSTVFKITRQSLALDSEVHASKGESLLFLFSGTFYVVLPGAEIAMLESLWLGALTGWGLQKAIGEGRDGPSPEVMRL